MGKKKKSAMFRPLLTVACVLVLLIAPLAQAQMAGDEGLEITGLVLDETKTKAGHDFYDFFNINWNSVPGLQYTIHVAEQPDLGRGSSIKVLINETQVFFQRLNPRTDAIEIAASNAVKRTRMILVRRLLVRKQLEGAP